MLCLWQVRPLATEAEEHLVAKLKANLETTAVYVEDQSGGCGAQYGKKNTGPFG